MTDSDDIEARAEKLVGDVWFDHGQWLGEPESLAAIVVALRAEREQGRERGREQGLRKAAECAKMLQFFWRRPGGAPGNGYVQLTGEHIASAILSLIPSPPKEPSP